MSGLLDYKNIPVKPGKLYQDNPKKQEDFVRFIKEFSKEILKAHGIKESKTKS